MSFIKAYMMSSETLSSDRITPINRVTTNENQDGPFTPPNPEQVIEFDVRPILAAGQDPLKGILFKLQDLKPGGALKIINTFEPLPLIDLLAKKGLRAHTEKRGPQYIVTWFFCVQYPDLPKIKPDITEETFETGFDEVLARYKGHLRTIDVRMLEMPGPMVTILEHLETLGSGEALFVYHKKKPLYLLPHLHQKGFNYLILKNEENDVNLLIYKS